MFTVIHMNLFEQAVIHIYNGKSVKNVYYDPPFGMDIASLLFSSPELLGSQGELIGWP